MVTHTIEPESALKNQLLRSGASAIVEKKGCEASVAWVRNRQLGSVPTETGSMASGDSLQEIVSWFEWAREAGNDFVTITSNVTESNW